MSIDNEIIIKCSSLIKETIDICQGLRVNSKIKTQHHSGLLKDMLEVATDCPERPNNFDLNVSSIQQDKLLDTICLTSGGADSTIAWYYHNKPQGIYIDIGQVYAGRETYCLQELNISTFYVDISNERLNDTYEDWKHIIPGRNFLFLTIAAEFVKDGGTIIFSVVDGEGFDSDKGDKSGLFLTKWFYWYKALTGKYINIEVMTDKTKAGWLKWFIDQKLDIDIIRHKTVTCFSGFIGTKGQCGSCQACLRKYLSFITNEVDISEDFIVHPMIGARQYVKKYKLLLNKALKEEDFKHYSKTRCLEDLSAIHIAEMRIKENG